MRVERWWLGAAVLLCLAEWRVDGEVTLPPGAGPGGDSAEDDALERRLQYPYVASPIRKFDREDEEPVYEEHSGLEFNLAGPEENFLGEVVAHLRGNFTATPALSGSSRGSEHAEVVPRQRGDFTEASPPRSISGPLSASFTSSEDEEVPLSLRGNFSAASLLEGSSSATEDELLPLAKSVSFTEASTHEGSSSAVEDGRLPPAISGSFSEASPPEGSSSAVEDGPLPPAISASFTAASPPQSSSSGQSPDSPGPLSGPLTAASPPLALAPGVQLVSLSHRPRSLTGFLADHALRISLPTVAQAASNLVATARFGFGKNSFLTGFGLGFLAFGLKKLLLPVFIGMQIVKSVLVAMFLPTVLSHVGKLVGKGVSNVASGSSATQHFAHDPADLEFKDTTDLDQDGAGSEGAAWAVPSQSHATLAALNPSFAQPTKDFNERYSPLGSKLPALPTKHHGSFYTKDPQQDYKIFHKIPSSSQLLAHYDPFYSPLLSRLDAVFQQLGTTSEACRQRLVCDMYSNPARFAPYSNLVSAQLSRELNELRKPSSDNPEILRFFRYMKAAKDGQDGLTCKSVYPGCVAPTAPTQGSPMLETFNQINKLVHARNLRQ